MILTNDVETSSDQR